MSGVRIKGLEKTRKRLEKISDEGNRRHIIMKSMLVIERNLKENIPVDRGVAIRSIHSASKNAHFATIRVGAEHGIYQNYGFTVRAGHVFYDRKTKSFKKIKETKFIQGKHFAEKTIDDSKEEIINLYKEGLL